jgi:hypothetical protein
MQDIAVGSLHLDVALGRKSTALVVAADDCSPEVKTAVRRDARRAANRRPCKRIGFLAQR